MLFWNYTMQVAILTQPLNLCVGRGGVSFIFPIEQQGLSVVSCRRVKRVVQNDTDENHHADKVILEKCLEAACGLAIASQPEVPCHHGGRNSDGQVEPETEFSSKADEDEPQQHDQLQASDDEQVNLTEQNCC